MGFHHLKTDSLSPARELRLYKKLGLSLFGRALLKWERLRGKRLENYHLSAHSPGALEKFHDSLLYNSALHTTSMGMQLFCMLALAFYPAYRLLALLILIPVLLNLWCILLQRYNYLRILLLEISYVRRKLPKDSDRTQVIAFVERLMGRSPVSLTASDIPMLGFLASLLPPVSESVPDTKVQRRVAALKKCFLRTYKVTFDSPETEAAFRALAANGLSHRLEILRHAVK